VRRDEGAEEKDDGNKEHESTLHLDRIPHVTSHDVRMIV
jgi:hypothetical protein